MNYPHLATMLAFYRSVFKDLTALSPAQRMCNRVSAKYVIKRILNEGIIFASQSLPELGKAIEASIISGKVLSFSSTFSRHYNSSLPSFCYDYFITLFDNDGHPRRARDSEAVFAYYALRQICLAFSKCKDIPSKMSSDEAIKSFSDRIVAKATITAPSWLLNRARVLIQNVVMDGDRLHPILAQWDSIPFGKHGPGAVAQREKGLSKWFFKCIKGADMGLYRFNDRAPLPKGCATPNSRVICVPKDFKSLRTICIEPKEFQFAQQGLWNCLKSLIHENALTRNSINFNHQEYNGRLCKREDLATIDLKDASDTVSLKLCRLLFPKEFFRLVTRYRSRNLSVNGKLLKPTCFASMGSALCFPIETLVFWAVAQAARHPNGIHKPLRVFGDDIVCPQQDAPYIVKSLEACGFKVNTNKTCINTPIRESCGSYTYAGFDVRCVRFKHADCVDPPSWAALVENCKQLYSDQLIRTSYALLLHLKQFWHVPFGRFGLPKSPDGFTCQSRWNADLQRREWRLPALEFRVGKGEIAGYAGLYAWLVGNSTKPHPYGTQKVKVDWVAES